MTRAGDDAVGVPPVSCAGAPPAAGDEAMQEERRA